MSDYRYVNALSEPAQIRLSIRQGEERISLTLCEDDARRLRNDLTFELRCVRILNKARNAAYREISAAMRRVRK